MESLFEVVREALETLGSEAANQDDLTGQEIANEALEALSKIERRMKRGHNHARLCPVCNERHAA